MLSKTPIELGNLDKRKLSMEIMRVAMMAELDAIDLYEQLAAQIENINVKKLLVDVAREEKTHFGEFQTMLLRMDEEQVTELEKGKKEVRELTEK
jgi:rubrerythrin